MKGINSNLMNTRRGRNLGSLRDTWRVFYLGVKMPKVTHGMTGSKEYRIWQAMIQRCTTPASPAYHRYGGRGISVCERWGKFSNFFADMGLKPEGLTLERIENNQGYSLTNCRWATWSEQNRNQRIRKDNTTGLRGVYQSPRLGYYNARIQINLKTVWLGAFPTIEEAAEARRQGEIKYWGKEK